VPCSSRDLFPTIGSGGFNSELQLEWNLGVLFPPQGNERSRQPAPVPLEFMNNRMTSRTKRDQPSGGVAAGAAVMDDVLIPCPAALTGVAITGENGVAMSAEAMARMSGLPIAAAAQASDGGIGSAAAEHAGLCRLRQGSV
jgi:hypothetical protein